MSSMILFELDFMFYFSQFAQIYLVLLGKTSGFFFWLCVDLIQKGWTPIHGVGLDDL